MSFSESHSPHRCGFSGCISTFALFNKTEFIPPAVAFFKSVRKWQMQNSGVLLFGFFYCSNAGALCHFSIFYHARLTFFIIIITVIKISAAVIIIVCLFVNKVKTIDCRLCILAVNTRDRRTELLPAYSRRGARVAQLEFLNSLLQEDDESQINFFYFLFIFFPRVPNGKKEVVARHAGRRPWAEAALKCRQEGGGAVTCSLVSMCRDVSGHHSDKRKSTRLSPFAILF